MASKKQTEKKQAHKHRQQTVSYQRKGVGGEGDKEAQTANCKISQTKEWKYNIQNITTNIVISLYDKRVTTLTVASKHLVMYTIIVTLCCTFEANIILFINFIAIKKK